MKRSPMPPRTTPLHSTGRPRAKKRPVSESHRIYGGRKRVEWVKSLPCIVASAECSGAIENAHAENGGLSRKADADTIFPACNGHHGLLHRQGVRWFQSHYGVDLKAAAAHTHTLWLESHA